MLNFRETGEEYLDDVLDEEASATDHILVGGKSRQAAENNTAGKDTNQIVIWKIMSIAIIFIIFV